MGFLNLVPVIHWHIRYVVAWRQSNTLEAGFCAKALVEALARGKPEVFNTVQGCKSTSLEFTQVSRDRGVRISMGGKGRYSDNIFVERLWRTLKYDEVYLEAYADTHEVCKGLEDYFRFHNQLGPHESLGYRTPGEVFHGEQGVVDGKSNGRRCSLERGSNHWPESRDSRLNPRRSCPNNRVHHSPAWVHNVDYDLRSRRSVLRSVCLAHAGRKISSRGLAQ